MKIRNSNAPVMSGALTSLLRANLGAIPVGLAALGLAFAPAPVAAQSSTAVATAEEAAVCLSLQRTLEDLRDVTETEGAWLDKNRDNSRYSDKEYNRRVARNNGKLEVLRGYIARYNRSCGRYRRPALASICTSNSGMLGYIYATDTCQTYRRQASD